MAGCTIDGCVAYWTGRGEGFICYYAIMKRNTEDEVPGCYFPRGSVGIPHRKFTNLTGNVGKTIYLGV